MKKAILAVLFLAAMCFAADSLTVTTIPRSQRIDTIKAALLAPSWSYDVPDTSYLKRNGIVRVRLQWINPGNVIVTDTTVIWRPSDVGIDNYRYAPRVKLHFLENK